MTFKRPATNRQLTFAEIAAETRLPENEVGLKKEIRLCPSISTS